MSLSIVLNFSEDKRRPGRETWTRIAKRYGHPIPSTHLRRFGKDLKLKVAFLGNTGKSGLTPIPNFIDTTCGSKQVRDFARLGERLKKY